LQFGLQLVSLGFLRVSEGRSPVAEFQVPLKISDCTIGRAGEKAAKFRRFSYKLTPARGGPARVQTMERTGSTMIVGFLIAVSWLNSNRPHVVWRIIARASMMGERQS
jgi:hypothetical protein